MTTRIAIVQLDGTLFAVVDGQPRPLPGFALARHPRRVRCTTCGALVPIAAALEGGCPRERERAVLELEQLERERFGVELEAIDHALELEQLEADHATLSARESARVRAAVEAFTGGDAVAGAPGAPGSTEHKP
jgi:hypothetical protein